MFFIRINKFFDFHRKNIPIRRACFSAGCIVRPATAKIIPERRNNHERRGEKNDPLGNDRSQTAGGPLRANGGPEKPQRSYVNQETVRWRLAPTDALKKMIGVINGAPGYPISTSLRGPLGPGQSPPPFGSGTRYDSGGEIHLSFA